MSTALTTQQPAFPSGVELDAMRNAAALISRSGLVPEAFRGKPEDVLVAVMTARGLGLDPMVALQKGYVVKGKFDIEVKVKLGLAMSRVPDFDHEVVEQTPNTCTVRGGRAGKAQHSVTFTIEQAQRMGLTGKGQWGSAPEDMLYNRALSRLLNRTCAHALFNLPVVLDEPDEVDVAPGVPSPKPSAERSGAVVVEDAAPTPAAPPPPAEPASQPVPEDWQGRLLRAVAKHYGRTEPGTHKNAYSKWIKANGEDLGRVVNLFYSAHGEPAVKVWLSVPPMDYERIALWLEARNEKRAGAAAEAAGGTDAAPAQVEPAGEPVTVAAGAADAQQPADLGLPPEDDEEPADPEPAEPAVVSGWQVLVPKGHLHLTNVLMACRHATKGARQFVNKSAKSGRYALVDEDVLLACGFVNGLGTAQPQWIDRLAEGFVTDGKVEAAANPAVWPMLCRAVAKVAEELRVDIG